MITNVPINKIITFLCILFSFHLTLNGQNKTHLKDENLKGNIKTIFVFPYEAKFENGKIEKGDLINSNFSIYAKQLIHYNTKGYISKIEKFDENENIKSIRQYTYDKDNFIVEDNEVDNNGKSMYKYVYNYNDKNQIIKETQFFNDYLYAEYIYNYTNNQIEKVSFFIMENNKQRSVTELDKNQNIISYKIWNENNHLKSHIQYFYNENNLKEKSIMFDTFFKRETKSFSKYKYDENKNLIEVSTFSLSDEKLESKKNYSYDFQQNLIEETEYNSENKENFKYSYQYEYDNKRNWIRKIILKNNIPETIIERKIIYY